MTTSLSAKFIATAALAAAALGGAAAAHARSDVYFSIGVQTPQVYLEPAPVYVQPAPVYYQPAPVYYEPVYYQPQTYFVPAPVYYAPPVFGVTYGGPWGGHRHNHRYYR